MIVSLKNQTLFLANDNPPKMARSPGMSPSTSIVFIKAVLWMIIFEDDSTMELCNSSSAIVPYLAISRRPGFFWAAKNIRIKEIEQNLSVAVSI